MSSYLPMLTDADLGEGWGEAGVGTVATGRGNLPLLGIDVDAALTGLVARVALTQTFGNRFDRPLEATYIFPLPDRAAVTEFRMEVGERVVEGVLKERGQARAEYDTAVREGRRASIAEEERPGVFTMRVGNLLPGERVTVRLVMTGPLPWDDGDATFRFPLVVAPRYIPGAPLDGEPVGAGTEPDTEAVPDASRISPPVLLPGFPNPVDLSIKVRIDPAGLDMGPVRSSLHAVVEEDQDGVRVVRVEPGERANRDFVLRIRTDDGAVATALAAAEDAEGGQGTFALTLLPPAGADAVHPRDVVFVLDRSGSMAGWKMVAARRAVARMVDSLTPRDRFLVLAFDNLIETPPGAEGSGGLKPSPPEDRGTGLQAAGAHARAAPPDCGPPEPGGQPGTGRDGAGCPHPSWRVARPRPGAGHRRAGGERGADPAPARAAARRGPRLHGRRRHRGQRGVPQAAGRARGRRLRAGRVRGPAGRGDGPGAPAHRGAGADRPGAGPGRAGDRQGLAGPAAPAGPVRRVAAGRERPVQGRPGRRDHRPGPGRRRTAVVGDRAGRRRRRHLPDRHLGPGPP